MSEVESKELSTLIITILKALSNNPDENNNVSVIDEEDKFLTDMIDIIVSIANNEKIVEDTPRQSSLFSLPNISLPKVSIPNISLPKVNFSLGKSDSRERSETNTSDITESSSGLFTPSSSNATDEESYNSRSRSTSVTGSLSNVSSGLGSVFSSLIPRFYKEPKEGEDFVLQVDSCPKITEEKDENDSAKKIYPIAYNEKHKCIMENSKVGEEVEQTAPKVPLE